MRRLGVRIACPASSSAPRPRSCGLRRHRAGGNPADATDCRGGARCRATERGPRVERQQQRWVCSAGSPTTVAAGRISRASPASRSRGACPPRGASAVDPATRTGKIRLVDSGGHVVGWLLPVDVAAAEAIPKYPAGDPLRLRGAVAADVCARGGAHCDAAPDSPLAGRAVRGAPNGGGKTSAAAGGTTRRTARATAIPSTAAATPLHPGSAAAARPAAP